MPGENYWSWSPTAANNGTADSLIDWHEGQTRASVNNSSRSELAAHAKNRNLLNGSIVTTGTANTQSFVSGLGFLPGTDTIPTGMTVRLRIGAGLTNIGSATLNMDGTGDVIIKTADNKTLIGGELVGNGYADFVFDGTNWIFLYGREFFENQILGGGGLILAVQKFTASGTYTPTPGMATCVIECVGGGGGGMGCTGDGSPDIFGAAGGGAGSYSRKLATAAAIGASQTVTIGAGGANGNPNGGNGTATSVGTLCVANGGGGGAFLVGGSGGAPGVGDVALPGNAGQGGYNAPSGYPTGGSGGAGYFGGATTGAEANGGAAVNGNGAAPNTGSGGSGAAANNTYGAAVGGNGGTGIVVITEYAGRGAPGPAGPQGALGPVGPVGPAGPSGGTFPDAPSDGKIYGRKNAAWASVAAAVTVADTPPATPDPGALWWDSISGNLYVWYVDPNSSEWVIVINGQTAGQSTLPTQQIFATVSSGTYTTPQGCRRIEVRMVGGGSGGGGSGSTGNGAPTSGTQTSFGIYIAGGGTSPGNWYQAGIGGVPSGFTNSGIAFGWVGATGSGALAVNAPSGFDRSGTLGGASPFGGAGAGQYDAAGISAAASTGSGGGGGGAAASITSSGPGCGGAAGAYVELTINNPAATYSYTVGNGGLGGVAGTSGFSGGNGGTGIIIVKEFY